MVPFPAPWISGLFDFPRYQVFVLAVSGRSLPGRVGCCSPAPGSGPSCARPPNTQIARALPGIDTGRWVTPVFGFGVGLAALAGVLAAPMRAVNSGMGSDLIITVFAVVVIGGLGSVFGSVLAGFTIGMIQALGNLYVPLCPTSVYLLMAVVLLVRPAGLFGEEEHA